jgi:hypothetical protein
VATLTSNTADTQQLSASVQSALGWATNPNYVYQDVPLQYSALNANYTVLEGNTEANAAAQTLLTFAPDVVVSFGSEEAIVAIEDLDAEWSMGPKPFYLVGPYNAGSPTLISFIGNGNGAATESRRSRVAGINFASAPANDPVLMTYTNNFVATFPQAPASATAYNNYYDAMYFAVYSLAAAPGSPLTGQAASTGMLDLTYTSPTGTSIAMGAASIGTVESTLNQPGSGSKISLDGTLGPPDFNQKTGARVGQGDVFCFSRYPVDAGIDEAGDTLAGQPYPVNDVLRLDADGGAPADGAALEGTFPCFDGMAPPP